MVYHGLAEDGRIILHEAQCAISFYRRSLRPSAPASPNHLCRGNPLITHAEPCSHCNQPDTPVRLISTPRPNRHISLLRPSCTGA
jgi:hypothetical protein